MVNENMFVDGFKTIEIGSVAVAGNVTVYTDYFQLPHVAGADFSLVAKVAGTTVEVDVEFEAGDVAPTVADGADANYSIPDDMSTLLELSDTLLHRTTVTPTLAKYGRLKLVGGVTNTSDVVFSSLNLNVVID